MDTTTYTLINASAGNLTIGQQYILFFHGNEPIAGVSLAIFIAAVFIIAKAAGEERELRQGKYKRSRDDMHADAYDVDELELSPRPTVAPVQSQVEGTSQDNLTMGQTRDRRHTTVANFTKKRVASMQKYAKAGRRTQANAVRGCSIAAPGETYYCSVEYKLLKTGLAFIGIHETRVMNAGWKRALAWFHLFVCLSFATSIVGISLLSTFPNTFINLAGTLRDFLVLVTPIIAAYSLPVYMKKNNTFFALQHTMHTIGKSEKVTKHANGVTVFAFAMAGIITIGILALRIINKPNECILACYLEISVQIGFFFLGMYLVLFGNVFVCTCYMHKLDIQELKNEFEEDIPPLQQAIQCYARIKLGVEQTGKEWSFSLGPVLVAFALSAVLAFLSILQNSANVGNYTEVIALVVVIVVFILLILLFVPASSVTTAMQEFPLFLNSLQEKEVQLSENADTESDKKAVRQYDSTLPGPVLRSSLPLLPAGAQHLSHARAKYRYSSPSLLVFIFYY